MFTIYTLNEKACKISVDYKLVTLCKTITSKSADIMIKRIRIVVVVAFM